MKKWIFPNSLTSLKCLYIITKAISEKEITTENHYQELMQVLNDNGFSRTAANTHPIRFVLFYKMVNQVEERYVITEFGQELINSYAEFQENEEKRAKFFFKVLMEISYPCESVETDNTYQVYPFQILFRLLQDQRLEYHITVMEFEHYLSVVHVEEDYEKLVRIIVQARNGIEPTEEILPIAQHQVILSGWCKQFSILNKDGDNLTLTPYIHYPLPPLSSILFPISVPFTDTFKKFTLQKYLFEGLSMIKIESAFYQDPSRRGFLTKEILDYYQISKDASGIYQNQDKWEVANYLLIQPDVRYRRIGKIIKEEKEPEETKVNYFASYQQYYLEHLEEYKSYSWVLENEQLRKEFLAEYPLERIPELTLEEYVLGTPQKNSLCYKIEFGKYKEIGPSIKGRNSFKHGIYYAADNTYRKADNQIVENPEEYSKSLLEQVYQFLKECKNGIQNFSIIEKYPLLKGMSVTLIKLAYLYYPTQFVGICASAKLKLLLDHFHLPYARDNTPEQLSNLLNNKIRENIPVVNNESADILGYSLYQYLEDNILNEPAESASETTVVTGADSILYYGVPGCGKSYIVEQQYGKEKNHIRIVFHPEYTNGEFVGQIFPELRVKENENGTKENVVEYQFKQGPFTKILKEALNNRGEHYYLIIEELNRGNAPAIFGDIFQLLDRDELGNSEYAIEHDDLSREIYGRVGEKIRIPSNLSVIATMNSSDQNVFTLDTAFKRRWTMEKISNDFDLNNKNMKEIALMRVPNTKVTWKDFVETINKEIVSDQYGTNGEDKQLGIFFVKKNCLRKDETEDPIATKRFAEKVLMYLWEDVARYDRSAMFRNCNTLDELIKEYQNIGLEVFAENISFPVEGTN